MGFLHPQKLLILYLFKAVFMLFLSPSFSSASKTQFYLHPSAMPLYPNISKDNAREQIVLMSPEKEALIKIKHCGVFFFFLVQIKKPKAIL